ncbi:MAG: hypothetical protein ABI456_20945 [Ktedonobacteraceae bacterium]
MVFPRMAAAIFVLLLIGTLSLLCISPVALAGPGLTYSSNLEHADGKIIDIEPGMSFVLKTGSGRSLYFQCAGPCRTLLGHMQRHELENAHTDVYYEEVGTALLALDVD